MCNLQCRSKISHDICNFQCNRFWAACNKIYYDHNYSPAFQLAFVVFLCTNNYKERTREGARKRQRQQAAGRARGNNNDDDAWETKLKHTDGNGMRGSASARASERGWWSGPVRAKGRGRRGIRNGQSQQKATTITIATTATGEHWRHVCAAALIYFMSRLGFVVVAAAFALLWSCLSCSPSPSSPNTYMHVCVCMTRLLLCSCFLVLFHILPTQLDKRNELNSNWKMPQNRDLNG